MVLPSIPPLARKYHDRRRIACDKIFGIHSIKTQRFRVRCACIFGFALVFIINKKLIKFPADTSDYQRSHFDPEDSRLEIDDQRKSNIERAIFYNIFVPSDDDDKNLKIGRKSKRDSALDLVEEQLRYHDAASAFVRSTPIFYTVIGDNEAKKDVERICGEVAKGRNNDDGQTVCRLLRSVEEGDEGLTLESVYDYCRNHSEAQVTYLHNKGSFHPSPQNTAMRRMLTKSVFSDACQAMPIDQCSVCSARFSPLPHTHMSGNMWTANCSYINRLIHPLKFASKMDQLVNYAVELDNDSVFPLPGWTYLDRPYDYGLNRFSFEYWVGSHPKLKPCDVYPDPSYAYGFLNLDLTMAATPALRVAGGDDGGSGADPIDITHNTWKPVLRRVPWIPLENFWHWSFNEWFCGRGRLSQYKFLYGVYPDADSFLWSYYEKPIKAPFKNFYSLLDRGCPEPVRKSDYL